MEPVYILSAARTAIGTFGSSLKDVPPAKLGAVVIAEALARSSLSADEVGHVVVGNVIPSIPKDAYIARIAAVEAGVPFEVPALTLNRLCGSGLQAIISAAQMVAPGECNAALAAGAESMTRAPHHVAASAYVHSGRGLGLVPRQKPSLRDTAHRGECGDRTARLSGGLPWIRSCNRRDIIKKSLSSDRSIA